MNFKPYFAGLVLACGFAAPASAAAGDTLIRVRGIMVAPNESSGGINPTFPTEKVKITNSAAPEIDFTYMASDNIGFELSLPPPSIVPPGRAARPAQSGVWLRPGYFRRR